MNLFLLSVRLIAALCFISVLVYIFYSWNGSYLKKLKGFSSPFLHKRKKKFKVIKKPQTPPADTPTDPYKDYIENCWEDLNK